jgi:hypothetical protein
MTTPRPSLLDLHPVEALLALLLISAAALHRLVVDPPRPIRRPAPYSSAAAAMREAWQRLALLQAQAIRQPQASAAPAVGISPGPTVAELRTMARKRGILGAGSRPIHKARRADLLSALGR